MRSIRVLKILYFKARTRAGGRKKVMFFDISEGAFNFIYRMKILLPFLQNYVQVWVKYTLTADKRAKISYWVILNVPPVASRDAIVLEISCCWKTVHVWTKQIVAVSIATNFTRKGTYLPSIVPSRCCCGWYTFNPHYPKDIQLTCWIALQQLLQNDRVRTQFSSTFFREKWADNRVESQNLKAIKDIKSF